MKGILFKPDMIQAIVEGRKTQTRRVANLPANVQVNKSGVYTLIWDDENECHWSSDYYPRYQVGETVYIKEAYSHYGNDLTLGVWTAQVIYKLDGLKRSIPFGHQFHPREKWWNTGKPINYMQTPLFMPAWAARYFIAIISVEPQRLWEITPRDCAAEGIEGKNMLDCYILNDFHILWDSINKKYPWKSNPWVWKYEFRMERK